MNNAPYPQIASDYESTVRCAAVAAPGMFLGAHGSHMESKYARMSDGANPFIDPQGLPMWGIGRLPIWEFSRRTK